MILKVSNPKEGNMNVLHTLSEHCDVEIIQADSNLEVEAQREMIAQLTKEVEMYKEMIKDCAFMIGTMKNQLEGKE